MNVLGFLLALTGLVFLAFSAGYSLYWNLLAKPKLVGQVLGSLYSNGFPPKVAFAGLTTYWDFMHDLAEDVLLPRKVRDAALREIQTISQLEDFMGPWTRARFHGALNAALRRYEAASVPDRVGYHGHQAVHIGS
jgi:hypothetical protein